MSKARAINKLGMEYKLVSETNEGDKVLVDDGFTCMEPWSKRTVKRFVNGDLYVECSHGEHNLDGQYETMCDGVEVEPYYIGVLRCY